MEKKYLTIKEAAKFLGVSPLTLRNWDKSGKFLAGRHPISNYRTYKLEQLEALMENIENSSAIRHAKITKPKIKKLMVKLIED